MVGAVGLVQVMGLVLVLNWVPQFKTLLTGRLKTKEIYSLKNWRPEKNNSSLYIVLASLAETKIVGDDGNLRL